MLPMIEFEVRIYSLGYSTVKVNQCFVPDYTAQNSPVDSENIKTSASHSSLPRLPKDMGSEYRIHLRCGSCHSRYQPTNTMLFPTIFTYDKCSFVN